MFMLVFWDNLFNQEGSHGTVVELCRRKALSTSDRILEMLNRVMVTVLKTSGSPADAVVPNKMCILELNAACQWFRKGLKYSSRQEIKGFV